MTYEQALAFWFGRVNYEQRSPNAADLRLDRMRALLRLLGDPHKRLRIVHVAGSKGKGSTSAMLASVLQRAGYRTGLFTSPHLCRVEERIQVDDTPITAEELTAVLEEVRPAVETLERGSGIMGPGENGVPRSEAGAPTFFEIATAVGFVYFVRRRVDIAVLEVGLGGRFDSTNVCLPLVSVITSISFDHTQQLGNRLTSIAMEKAGIVKPGRPAISGATATSARQVIEEICRRRGAPLRQLGIDFHYSYEPGKVTSDQDTAGRGVLVPFERPRVRITTRHRPWPVLELGLLGEHQAANAAVAVASVERLRAEGLRISDEAVAAGLAEVRWPARLEVLGRRPLVLLDCAHNVASVQALVDTLRASFPAWQAPGGRRLLIFAGSGDKDLPGMLHVLAPHFTHVFFTRYGSSPRSVPPEQLGDLLRGVADLPFTVSATAAAAWQAARALARPEDLVCVAGSVFLAGELRPVLLQAPVPV
ncbi:MAG TPA: folylpolyglutamate synthase/dihydrofolate synthase family protein [Gemmataceae bacterium]|nr:folylpolyglutamate synthase/dihydrofolate synthase family protein [Gemmataceae bacterium]